MSRVGVTDVPVEIKNIYPQTGKETCSALKDCLNNFDSKGKIEENADIIQKLYYAVAMASIIRSYFTPNGIKGSLGLLWVYDQDFWNILSCVCAVIGLPRQYREAHNPETQSILKSVIFWSTAAFFPLFLLPITVMCIVSSTQDALKSGVHSALFNSDDTLGNVTTLFLGTLFYGMGMGICALSSLCDLLEARSKLNKIVREASGDIQEENQIEIQSNKEKYRQRASVLNLSRDTICSLGAVLGACSMLFYPDKLLLSSMIMYGISTCINVPEGFHKLSKKCTLFKEASSDEDYLSNAQASLLLSAA